MSRYRAVATTNEQHWEMVECQAKRSRLMYAATFRGTITPDADQAFRHVEHAYLLVGVNNLDDYEAIQVAVRYAHEHPNTEVRVLPKSCMKCFIFINLNGQLTAIVGGRNLTNSTGNDLSVLITNETVTSQLYRAFAVSFQQGESVPQFINEPHTKESDPDTIPCPNCETPMVRSREIGQYKKQWRCLKCGTYV